jgi:hypothetical protein
MKFTMRWLGALLAAGWLVSFAQAQNPCYCCVYPYYPGRVHFTYPGPLPPRPPAPDLCGPGFYDVNCCGAVHGPNYCVRPPWPPYNGERPNLSTPTHPFARGPRDYFMLEH